MAHPQAIQSPGASGLAITRVGLADLERVLPLLDAYRRFQGVPTDTSAARAFLAARLGSGESFVFLASAGEVAAGFAQVYPSFSTVSLAPVMILNDLFVASEFRRRKVGSALLNAVERFAESRHAVRLSLNVARSNAQAQSFYETHGWHRDDQYFLYLRS